MKSPLLFLSGVVVVATGVTVGGKLLTPKVRTASRAEIEAVLPASLKATDTPDPAGEARYARLVALLKPISDRDFSQAALVPKNDAERQGVTEARARIAQTFGSLKALLNEGGVRCPTREAGTLFPELAKLRGLSKVLAFEASDAAERGDQDRCAQLVALNLRLGKALVESKGVLMDELVAIAAEAVANRSAYDAEMKGGLDAKGRATILALMPAQSGAMPELGDSLRRDFQVSIMPFLLHPAAHMREAVGDAGMGSGSPEGTFDPVATAQLVGRIDDATIADTNRPFRLQTKLASQIAAQAQTGLPSLGNLDDMPEGLEKVWLKFKYRMAMNSQPNTIGRGLASSAVFELGRNGARRAAARNLVRSVILLRTGRTPSETDPYGDGLLHVDAVRKIVWSVGENGQDDGGQIGASGGVAGEPDYGFPYGKLPQKAKSLFASPGPGFPLPGGPPPPAGSLPARD